MTEPNVISIDEMCWGATKYSDVLKIDPRIVKQALETVPYQMRGARQVWHVRDAWPAIYARVGDKTAKKRPDDMEPKDELDYYRAKREKLKLAEDIRKMVPAADIERTIGEAFKVLAQTLDSLPDALERDCALPPGVVVNIQRAVDNARDLLYTTLMSALEVQGG
ncbi:MAG: DUF1441 family protein [Candidatus Competibacteraceae bacterium]